MAKPLPSMQLIRDAVEYSADGRLIWRRRPRSHFASDRAHKMFNKRYEGTPALGTVNSNGYLYGGLNGRKVLAHRVVWAYFNGDAQGEIDHINGDPSDNRIENLRVTDRVGNGRNLCRSKRNKSGVTGVCQLPSGRWNAHIKVDAGQVSLGSYGCITAAALARKRAEALNGYHPNHGRSA